MTSAWNRAWGESWGLSWGLTYEANQDDLYGRSTNPNLKLRRIVDVHVAGSGAQLVVSGGRGDVRAGRERSQSVRLFGVGAAINLRTGSGKSRAEQCKSILQNGAGGRLFPSAGRGTCLSGSACGGRGAQLRLVCGTGSQTVGVTTTGTGNQLSITAGQLDDVFTVKNPTDEELAVLAITMFAKAA